MTEDLNDFYGVTVFHAEWVGPRHYMARARVFRRDTFKVVDEFYTEGATMSSADTRALVEGERRFGPREMPADWKGQNRGVQSNL